MFKHLIREHSREIPKLTSDLPFFSFCDHYFIIANIVKRCRIFLFNLNLFHVFASVLLTIMRHPVYGATYSFIGFFTRSWADESLTPRPCDNSIRATVSFERFTRVTFALQREKTWVEEWIENETWKSPREKPVVFCIQNTTRWKRFLRETRELVYIATLASAPERKWKVHGKLLDHWVLTAARALARFHVKNESSEPGWCDFYRRCSTALDNIGKNNFSLKVHECLASDWNRARINKNSALDLSFPVIT